MEHQTLTKKGQEIFYIDRINKYTDLLPSVCLNPGMIKEASIINLEQIGRVTASISRIKSVREVAIEVPRNDSRKRKQIWNPKMASGFSLGRIAGIQTQ